MNVCERPRRLRVYLPSRGEEDLGWRGRIHSSYELFTVDTAEIPRVRFTRDLPRRVQTRRVVE